MALELSDIQLDQALMLIRMVPTFDGTPEELCPFIKSIESILKLYPTEDERQNKILNIACYFRLVGGARGLHVWAEVRGSWAELKTALIKAFNNHASYEELLRQLYSTRFNGNLRNFVEELEHKAFKIRSKLGLDDNASHTAGYSHALKNTIRNVISRKLPDWLFMTLIRHDISTIPNLKKAAQMHGFYEINSRTAENYNDPNNNYTSSDNSYQNDYAKSNNCQANQNLQKKQNSDISARSLENTRLILRAHRHLK